MTEHSFYMERAIQLAKRGTGFTNPNPLVGAVIVKDSRIIGEGWHARYGDLHAERNALKHCTEDPAGATIYVSRSGARQGRLAAFGLRFVRHAGALLPPRQAAPLHRGAGGERHSPGVHRFP